MTSAAGQSGKVPDLTRLRHRMRGRFGPFVPRGHQHHHVMALVIEYVARKTGLIK